MAIEALCPTCGAVFNLKDEYEGKKVRCKKCEQTFTVAGERAAARDGDRGVKSKADAAPAKKSARDDDDDERSSRKGRAAAKRGRDDDDDDKPRKRKRTYHDDDDDDDDRPSRRAPRRSSGGGTGKVLAIVGGAVALIVLVCGGAIYGIVRIANNVEEEAAAQQQDWQNAANNGGNPWGGGFPGFERQPKDMGEALTFLKGNDPNEKRGAANWLANQPLDAGKQKEVATALEGLVKDTDDNNCAAGARAMKVWGTKDNGPALATALRARPEGGIPGEAHKQLMAALGHVKYEAGADEIMRFLNNFFVGGDAERALAEFGPGAEKVVLKAYFHPDGGVRARARGLCVRYETKPLTILTQAVTDLGSIDRGRSGAVLEWLGKFDSNAALEATKADPARRTAVAAALNKVIDDPQANGDQVLAACKRWATADNVAALIRRLESDPWKKKEYADVLIAIGPACEAQVKLLLGHTDGNVVKEAKRILNAVGGADSKFEAVLADLRSGDNGRISEAARALQRGPVDEKQRAAVVTGLLGAINGDGFFQGNDTVEAIAKALSVWANKEDGLAVVDKLSPLKKPFLNRARGVLMDWMGKQKVDKAIPFLVGCLNDRDDYQNASKALQAMGPDFGAKVEEALGAVQVTEKVHLLEVYKVLGAVGTQKAIAALKQDQLTWTQKKDTQLALAAKQAADAIAARGK